MVYLEILGDDFLQENKIYTDIKIRKICSYLKKIGYAMVSLRKPRNAVFLSDEELVSKLLKERASFIRYGDGEFLLMDRKEIHYQTASEELARELESILQEYCADERKISYYVGMQKSALACNGLFMLRSPVQMSLWAHTRRRFLKEYDCNVMYGNTTLFRFGNEKVYQNIWTESKLERVIFVHNKEMYAREFEKKYGIQTTFVKCASRDSYEDKVQLKDNIKKAVAEDKENVMVLMSAGPGGKVVGYELVQEGLWVIDTGHCWDEPLPEGV